MTKKTVNTSHLSDLNYFEKMPVAIQKNVFNFFQNGDLSILPRVNKNFYTLTKDEKEKRESKNKSILDKYKNNPEACEDKLFIALCYPILYASNGYYRPQISDQELVTSYPKGIVNVPLFKTEKEAERYGRNFLRRPEGKHCEHYKAPMAKVLYCGNNEGLESVSRCLYSAKFTYHEASTIDLIPLEVTLAIDAKRVYGPVEFEEKVSPKNKSCCVII